MRHPFSCGIIVWGGFQCESVVVLLVGVDVRDAWSLHEVGFYGRGL